MQHITFILGTMVLFFAALLDLSNGFPLTLRRIKVKREALINSKRINSWEIHLPMHVRSIGENRGTIGGRSSSYRNRHTKTPSLLPKPSSGPRAFITNEKRKALGGGSFADKQYSGRTKSFGHPLNFKRFTTATPS